MPVVFIILAAVIIAALGGLFAAYYKIFYSPHRGVSELEPPAIIDRHPYRDQARELIRELSELPCEFISARSYDGLKLSARLYEGGRDKPVCICFHGYRGAAVRDFSGGGLFLIGEGYNVILPDQRAHWRSGGHTITFGIRERYDVLTWIDYVNERFGPDTPIYLFGISMGGGTVLMASGLDLPDNVRAIAADCPFDSAMDIILHVGRKTGLSPTVCRPLARLSALIYGRFDLNAVTAADAVKHTKKPILIIHGEGDNFVPMSMSMRVKQANPAMVEYHSFPEAGHGLSYIYDTPRYQRLVRDFINKHP